MTSEDANRGPNEALIGVPGSRHALTTPALVLDLDRVEANIASMAVHARRHGYALRPVAKVHKSTHLARLQAEAGAIGTCCSTLAEAEVMVDAGIAGVLLFTSVVTRPEARPPGRAQRARRGPAGGGGRRRRRGRAGRRRAPLGPAAAGAGRRRGRRRSHGRGRSGGGGRPGAARRGRRRAGVRGRAGLQRQPPGDGRLRRAPRRRGGDDGDAARLRGRARRGRAAAADRVAAAAPARTTSTTSWAC